MKKVKISAVSYLNTKPFIYGLEHSGFVNEIELSLDMPSLCAAKLIENKVDAGLVPVAVIPLIPGAEIISNYCIGARGPVRTVVLVSEVPLEEVDTIILDYQSRTSVMLARVLARFFWKKEVKWLKGEPGYHTRDIKGKTAGVVIGDRVFEIDGHYPHVYDLSQEWANYTGLDFVFACWTANKLLPEEFKKALNEALAVGIDNMPDVIQEIAPQYPDYNLAEYYSRDISYPLDEFKRKGLELFWNYAEKLES